MGQLGRESEVDAAIPVRRSEQLAHKVCLFVRDGANSLKKDKTLKRSLSADLGISAGAELELPKPSDLVGRLSAGIGCRRNGSRRPSISYRVAGTFHAIPC